MKLQQLETFYWTVKLGNFALAAERLHATQSAVSMRIRELEKSLGVELFDRTHRSARLTDKGRELMEHAGRILEMLDDVRQSVSAPESIAGYVRLGVAEVVSMTWLPRLIDVVSREYPQVRLEIDEGLTGELMEGLQNGSLDLVLAPGRAPLPDIHASSIGHVEFAWMASPRLGLGNRRHDPAELSRWPVIGLNRRSYHYAGVEDWFRRGKARPRYLARCKSMSVAASMTVAGLGISYLPLRCYERELELHELETLTTTSPSAPVGFLAARPAEEHHSLARRVAKLAREVSDFDKSIEDEDILIT